MQSKWQFAESYTIVFNLDYLFNFLVQGLDTQLFNTGGHATAESLKQ